MRDRILAPLRNAAPFNFMYGSPLPAELHDTTYITDMGLDFMRRHRQEHGDRPFFCHISYVDPHDPYDPPKPSHVLRLGEHQRRRSPSGGR